MRSKSNLRALLLVPSELAGCIRRKGLRRLTPTAIAELAAPQTWGASVMPVILAAALAIASGAWIPNDFQSIALFFSVLATAVCLQCAVNTLNDYADFMSGVDRKENCIDPKDASIVYHNYEPVLAFVVGGFFILLALVCGLYALFTVGPELLIFGAIGAAVVIAYTFGLLPLSYTPTGEFVSGFVMGGIIPLACYYAFTETLSFQTLLFAIPVILTIALIMLANNASDIEKDAGNDRMTLATKLGRPQSARLHAILFTFAMAAAGIIVCWKFRGGAWILPLFAAWLIPLEVRLTRGGFVPEKRIFSMSLITGINIRLNAVYGVMIVLSILAPD
ncbi:MAG: prenyltransferase [Clostridiales Family XIII bacterium]|jgi:1,4-dihydroxy-2-naphthoate octaprenyltransferase|nr:prenyltransferase [Clostridiales Family XIII bacterium]